MLILAPLRLEAALISSGAPGLRVRRVGMGQARSRAAVSWLAADPAPAIVVMGVCGGLVHGDAPGEVIVAERVWAIDENGGQDGEAIACAAAQELAEGFAGRGLPARRGAVACSQRIVHGQARARLAQARAAAVEMESAWLAPAARGRPFVVIRVIADTPVHDLRRPDLALRGWLRAGVALRRAARELEVLAHAGALPALTG